MKPELPQDDVADYQAIIQRLNRLESALINRLAALELARGVRGTVSSDGDVVRGTGFSVVKTGTGQYTVTYTTAFDTTPVVTFGLGASGTGAAMKLTSEAESTFSVVTYTPAGAAVDSPFSFHALPVG